jgi:hypothetical protein
MGPLLGGNPAEPGPGFVLWGTAPMVVAVLIRCVTRDWTDLGIKPAFKKNVRGYVISFLACPIRMALTLIFGVLISATSISGFSLVPYVSRVVHYCFLLYRLSMVKSEGLREVSGRL